MQDCHGEEGRLCIHRKGEPKLSSGRDQGKIHESQKAREHRIQRLRIPDIETEPQLHGAGIQRAKVLRQDGFQQEEGPADGQPAAKAFHNVAERRTAHSGGNRQQVENRERPA